MFGLIQTPLKQAPPTQIVQQYANGLTVRAPRAAVSIVDGSLEWSGGVEITYGPTRITADRFFLHNDEKDPYGQAVGKVRLVDPEGTIDAADLTFHWVTRTGEGHNVVVRVSSLTVVAESIDLKPDLWTLRNVGATGCQLKTPLYYIRTRELQVRPGLGAKAFKPELSILGKKIATLPDQSLSFNGDGASFDLPLPSYRSNLGFGVTWANQLDFDSQSAVFSRYATFQHAAPFYNAMVMHSFVEGRKPTPIRTEIGDRFGFGYFDSVQTRSPLAEQQYIKTKRLEVGVGTTFGADLRENQPGQRRLNKPIEFVGEGSGAIGPFGIFAIVRAQQVHIVGDRTINRVLLEQNLLSPLVALGSGFSLFGRADAAEFMGGNRYSWIRGQAGLAYEPTPALRFGVSYSAVRTSGVPDFEYDEPFRSRELSFRGDLDFDTTQLRLLVKYDPTAHQIYDREIYFSQVIGCIEPFVVYRERPHKFFVGLKLPIGRVFDRLSKAELERRAVRHPISGAPPP